MKEPNDYNDFEFDDLDCPNADYDDYSDYDAYDDEELNSDERNSLMKNNIGYNLLQGATNEQRDNIEFLAALYELYEMNLDYIMRYASERICDLYDIGNAYLSPLFKFENDKYNYIISMIREWDRATNKKEIYGYKNILSKVYKVPNRYIKYSLKYLYTRDEYCESSITHKIKILINKIKSRLTKPKYLNDIDSQALLKDFEEITSGAKAEDMAWLIEYNQKSAIKSNEDNFDEDLDAEGIHKISKENIEIMCYLDALYTIVSKPQLDETDKHMFYRIMSKLDAYASLSRQQRDFVEEHQDFEN